MILIMTKILNKKSEIIPMTVQRLVPIRPVDGYSAAVRYSFELRIEGDDGSSGVELERLD